MSWTLAITGKGGTGKTTFAALATRWLGENGLGPVLAVDADPNACLDAPLGVEVAATVGGVREEAKQLAQSLSASAGGMGKAELLDLKIQQALVEADSFDLIAMGRPEGPGCYCYANSVLRGVIERLARGYRSMVIDNEAGLENLSRRLVSRPDVLLFVSPPTPVGLRTARRLFDLAREMGIDAGTTGVVVNQALDPGRARALSEEQFQGTSVELLGILEQNQDLAEHDARGEPLLGLPPDNPVYGAVSAIMSRLCGPDGAGGGSRN